MDFALWDKESDTLIPLDRRVPNGRCIWYACGCDLGPSNSHALEMLYENPADRVYTAKLPGRGPVMIREYGVYQNGSPDRAGLLLMELMTSGIPDEAGLHTLCDRIPLKHFIAQSYDIELEATLPEHYLMPNGNGKRQELPENYPSGMRS